MLKWFKGNGKVKLPSEHLEQEQSQRLVPSDLETSEDVLLKDYTSQKEIMGWCLYSWAAEPFIVCAVSTYVPILLEQFARENGVRLDDHSQPCIITPSEPLPPILPPPSDITTPLQQRDLSSTATPIRCVVYVLGHYIDTSSLALYTFSFSVLIQTLVVISMSGAADRSHHRKQLLIIFGLIGSIATIAYIFITSKRYYIASLLAIIANSCFGAVNVCGNSFLPVLVNNSKTIIESHNLQNVTTTTRPDTGLKSNLTTKISGMGSACGYISSLLVQILSMFLVIKTGSTTKSIQCAIFLVGVWWLIFQIPIIFLLKSRPGPQLQLHNNENVFFQYFKHGWKTLFISINQASMLRDVLIYLIGWFIVSDSITTINSAAVLFARSELQMPTSSLVVVSILTVISAIAGSIGIPQLQAHYMISPKTSLILIIIWASVIPLYGILGLFFKFIGLKHVAEMYILAIWYGIALGGLATVSRSLFSLLIPKGKESIFFSLFSVTDKGSSILGPAITAMITDKTHNIRYTFYFLFLFLIIATPVYSLLDVERGQKEAQELEHVDNE